MSEREPIRVGAGELTAEEILEALRSGHRIVVEAELFGATYDMTLRHDGTTYYCDTPTTLHKHDDEDGMRECIEQMGYSAGEE